jgi:hypothetical protein
MHFDWLQLLLAAPSSNPDHVTMKIWLKQPKVKKWGCGK